MPSTSRIFDSTVDHWEHWPWFVTPNCSRRPRAATDVRDTLANCIFLVFVHFCTRSSDVCHCNIQPRMVYRTLAHLHPQRSQDLGLSEASGRHRAGNAANFTISGKKGRSSATCWQWRLEAQSLVKNEMWTVGHDRSTYRFILQTEVSICINWVQKLFKSFGHPFRQLYSPQLCLLKPGQFCSHCQSWLSCSSALPSCSTTSRCLRV